jgi:asparagine synthase (glutamine-hydrolysing)
LFLSSVLKLVRFLPKQLFPLLYRLTSFKFFRLLAAGVDGLKGESYRIQGEDIRKNLYTPAVIKMLEEVNEGALVDRYSAECASKEFIEKSYWSGFMTENQHAITIIADLAGMANGVEIRAPFLDHKMVEFAAQLPVRMKVRSFFKKQLNKYIMKKSMEGVLPKEILYAPKMGLGYHIKIDELLRGEWKEQAEKILFGVLPQTNLFNMSFIRQKFQEQLEGKNNSPLLWGLVVFGVWYKQFMENERDDSSL